MMQKPTKPTRTPKTIIQVPVREDIVVSFLRNVVVKASCN
jgi:hypothetical protein